MMGNSMGHGLHDSREHWFQSELLNYQQELWLQQSNRCNRV
jgi:hypothetical protein